MSIETFKLEMFKSIQKNEEQLYNVKREGTKIKLRKNDKTVAVVFVDVTDNRVTLESLDHSVEEAGIKKLTDYLDCNIGAKQIFIVPSEHQEKFKKCGFTFVDPANKMKERLRETSFSALSSISAEALPALQFIHGYIVENATEENIMALAQGSNFLLEKIKQYEEQGYPGFRLMCKYSYPLGICDEKGELVAFCRVTSLENGNYYLSDTFVDEKVFGDKPKGTAFLYQFVGKHYKEEGSVFLIAPPERVEEFDSQYGCAVSNNAMFKFKGPQAELKVILDEEMAMIKLVIEKEKSAVPSFNM